MFAVLLRNNKGEVIIIQVYVQIRQLRHVEVILREIDAHARP
jgi:hypothetical protein